MNYPFAILLTDVVPFWGNVSTSMWVVKSIGSKKEFLSMQSSLICIFTFSEWNLSPIISWISWTSSWFFIVSHATSNTALEVSLELLLFIKLQVLYHIFKEIATIIHANFSMNFILLFVYVAHFVQIP